MKNDAPEDIAAVLFGLLLPVVAILGPIAAFALYKWVLQ